jgi:hypothetical protein
MSRKRPPDAPRPSDFVLDSAANGEQLRLPGATGKVRDLELPTPLLDMPRPSRRELVEKLEFVLAALKGGWR